LPEYFFHKHFDKKKFQNC